MKYVIIGSGVAGISAVEAIRTLDTGGDILLAGDDPHGYYSRPGLAYYLTGELHDKALFPKTANDYRKLNFRYDGSHVDGIDRINRTISLTGGGHTSYDRLLIAVGAQAIPLQVPGAGLGGVLKLDHMNDAKRILKFARRRKTAVVVGGGITALELVDGLVSHGMKVHYLLRGDRYWSNVLDEQESKIIHHRLEEEGVSLHYNTELVEITGKNGLVQGVRLSDESSLRCDLVTYAVGIRPRLELARQAGLEIDRGILVNEFLQTNDLNIYAAGDVAQVYDPISGTAVLDSLWGPARQQGYTAGLNMAGRQTAYQKPAPFNVTRLAGLTTTIIGTVGRGKDSDLVGIARGDSETWRQLPEAIMAQTGFDVNRLRLLVGERTLLGAVVMGDQKLSFPLEKIISGNVDISLIREKLLTPNAKIADVLVEFWTSVN